MYLDAVHRLFSDSSRSEMHFPIASVFLGKKRDLCRLEELLAMAFRLWNLDIL